MLGIATLTLLADKFQKENVNGIRFWYTFQTPKLGQLWAKQNSLDQEDDEHFISDRLSFFKRRTGEEVITTEMIENKFWATLIIDI